jgi:hypothetical protein
MPVRLQKLLVSVALVALIAYAPRFLVVGMSTLGLSLPLWLAAMLHIVAVVPLSFSVFAVYTAWVSGDEV